MTTSISFRHTKAIEQADKINYINFYRNLLHSRYEHCSKEKNPSLERSNSGLSVRYYSATAYFKISDTFSFISFLKEDFLFA